MAGAKNITVIPAKKRVGNTVTAEDKPKLKVAAYCRVSTDSEEQATSYDAQVEHYTEFIRKNHEWEFAGILHTYMIPANVENLTGQDIKKYHTIQAGKAIVVFENA